MDNPIYQYPFHTTGPEALEAFLRATNATPTVGQTVYQFTITGRTEADADKFVQAIRGALSKKRGQYKSKYGRRAQAFTMTTVDRTPDKQSGRVLIALGRKQKGVKRETLGLEMASLLTQNFNSERNANWARMLDELKTKSEVILPAHNWERLALGVIFIYQQNAVYKGFDEEQNAHIISRI